MIPVCKYAFSFDGEEFDTEEYDTIADALVAASKSRQGSGPYQVYIGRIQHYEPLVSGFRVLEMLQQQAYDESDGWSGDYLDNVSPKDERKLQEMLTATFKKWAKETYNEPDFSTVDDIVVYDIDG